MNSKTKFNYSMKAAMREDSKDVWQPFLQQTSSYLLGLKNCKGGLMAKEDRRKTGFIGIVANIHSVQEIFNLVVTNGPLSYLCLYKLSQDHLEHFFGLIRAKYGANNNPSPYQFKKTFRQILLGVTGSIVENGNVTLQDNTEVVALIPSAHAKIDYLSEHYDFDDVDLEIFDNYTHSEYKKTCSQLYFWICSEKDFREDFM